MNDVGELWFAPAIVIHYVILAHLCGGLCLGLGLLTRITALIQIPALMGAVFIVHLPKMNAIGPRESLEFSALVLFLLVLIVVRGAGRFSVDYYLSQKETT